jgi:dihydrodipicolinate synthase/N-acetylneuraminate lyase
MLLHGIFPPVTTPFYADGSVYFKKLESNVAQYSKSPVAGIVVLGSTGEAILLSDQERRDVLKVAREAGAPHSVLIAGTGLESANETLRLTEYAAELGYDAGLVRTPHYYKGQMKPLNILTFFRTVADRSPLPVLIYNFPQATGYDIPVEVVVALADHPNIVGIKESSGDVEKVRKMVAGTAHVKRTATVTGVFAAVTGRMSAAESSVAQSSEMVPATVLSGGTAATVQAPPKFKTRTKEIGFQVLVGAAQKLEPSLRAGSVGAILAFACPAPTACFEIYAAWKEGDFALAREKQERLAAAAQRIVSDMGIPAVKYAMDLNGYYGGPVRLPLLPLDAQMKAEVERHMAKIRN